MNVYISTGAQKLEARWHIYLPPRFSEILLQLRRYGAVNILTASGVTTDPVNAVEELILSRV